MRRECSGYLALESLAGVRSPLFKSVNVEAQQQGRANVSSRRSNDEYKANLQTVYNNPGEILQNTPSKPGTLDH